jgi:ferritin-like metal-binding protein YciE
MSLRDVLLDELKDLYSAENQLIKYLPKAAKAAETAELKQGFLTHLEDTKNQVERLKQIFGILGKKATGKHCDGMEGAIDEVKEAMDEESEGAVYDSGIVGGAMRVEHYEIAGYSAAILIATTLGESQVVSLLKETLAEEQTMSKQLIAVGKTIFKAAYQEEGDDKKKPEKKPKDAKQKLSEKESLDDEKEAQKGLNQSAQDSMDGEDEPDDEKAKSEEESEDAEKLSKKAAAARQVARKAAGKKSAKKSGRK